MSWTNQLYNTYETKCKNTFFGIPMTPIAHMNSKAQIEVTLNEKGDFLSAIKVNPQDEVTLIPVTEKSSGRSSGAAPHALCDTLSYVAGDYSVYCENEKLKRSAENKYGKYMQALKMWVDSDYSHPKIRAIYDYLSMKKLVSDLILSGIISLNNQNLFDNEKINGQTYDKALVRFRVTGLCDSTDKTWEDAALIQTYTDYYLSTQQGNTDICYLSGEKKTISENHPKGIVASDYGAKLVSGNDNQGYTYRGRFQTSEQAYALSYEASQKIHSALTWLVKNQGVYAGSKDKRMFVCWNADGKRTPSLFNFMNCSEDTEQTETSYRSRLKKSFQGYTNEFEEGDTITVMALDAATTGRLSIVYYNEYPAIDFLERMLIWGSTCCWKFLSFTSDQKPVYEVRTPTFRRIVNCAFGRERGNSIDVDDKVLKEQTQRLLKCMLDNAPIPYDIIHALAWRASTPLAYSRFNRETVLSTACAMISKYNNRTTKELKGEEEEMKLDHSNTDRSYLFGRLLAIYEKIERNTYEHGENRDPNALRLQSAFANHPFQTWKILESAIVPYLQKLNPALQNYYKNLIGKIVILFEDEDTAILNQSLKETYLLGYYLQREELNKKKEETEEK